MWTHLERMVRFAGLGLVIRPTLWPKYNFCDIGAFGIDMDMRDGVVIVCICFMAMDKVLADLMCC